MKKAKDMCPDTCKPLLKSLDAVPNEKATLFVCRCYSETSSSDEDDEDNLPLATLARVEHAQTDEQEPKDS